MDLVRVVALGEEALRRLKFSFAFERLPSCMTKKKEKKILINFINYLEGVNFS